MALCVLTDWGVEQTAEFANEDLHDEELTEVDMGTWLQEAAQSLQSNAALLLGDCNAGKSTLLRAFAENGREESRLPMRDHLLLQSLVPMLSARFQNLRYCDVAAIAAAGRQPETFCCDHEDGSLVDSDLARLSVNMTQADWRFLLEELQAPEDAGCAHFARFTLLELGGDHLLRLHKLLSNQDDDSLLRNTHIRRICNASLELLQQPALATVTYFVNAQLWREEAARSPLARSLIRNLQLLRKLAPQLQTLRFLITRLPEECWLLPNSACDDAEDRSLSLDATLIANMAAVIGGEETERFVSVHERANQSEAFMDIKEMLESTLRTELRGSQLQTSVMPFVLMLDPAPRVSLCSMYYFYGSTLKATLTTEARTLTDGDDVSTLKTIIEYLENTRFVESPAGNEDVVEVTCWFSLRGLVASCEHGPSNDMPLPVMLTNFESMMARLVAAGACLKGRTLPTPTRLQQDCGLGAYSPWVVGHSYLVLGESFDCPDTAPGEGPHDYLMYRFPSKAEVFDETLQAMRTACRLKPLQLDWEYLTSAISEIRQRRPQTLTAASTRPQDLIELTFDSML